MLSKENFKIPLDKFINLALYDPKQGYYMKRNPFGKKGDFVTAPNISKIFSEMFLVWMMSYWQKFYKNKKINIVELGAGNGEMMHQIIITAKNFDKFYNSFENLPESSQSRVSVTNEREGCWNCQNLFKWLHLYCGGEYGKFFPLVYNNLNHKLNPSVIGGKEVTDKQNVEAFKHTWPENNVPCFFWDEEPLDDAFSKEIPSFGEDIGWICCGINSDQNIFQMKGIAIKDENLNLSSFDDLLSVKVEIDDSEINETEIDIAHKKIKEALETKADVIAAACPFCNTMMHDGVKNKEKEGKVAVMDIAQLLAQTEDL